MPFTSPSSTGPPPAASAMMGGGAQSSAVPTSILPRPNKAGNAHPLCFGTGDGNIMAAASEEEAGLCLLGLRHPAPAKRLMPTRCSPPPSYRPGEQTMPSCAELCPAGVPLPPPPQRTASIFQNNRLCQGDSPSSNARTPPPALPPGHSRADNAGLCQGGALPPLQQSRLRQAGLSLQHSAP